MSANTAIINIDKELCTGCKRCSEVCPVDAIEGNEGEVQSINTDKCILCGQCVQICKGYASIYEEIPTPFSKKMHERGMLNTVKEPIFAAYNMGQVKKVNELLDSKDLLKVVQCAPAVRVALSEEFEMPLGTLTPGKMAAALRRLGFDKIYDTNFAADLTIMEEGTELIKRITEGGVLPMFTSCCPAWVKYLEHTNPELLANLSTCKSPQQMGGAIIKTYGAKINGVNPSRIYSVSVMPCTCKAFEAEREEMQDSGYRDVDVAITTRELAQLIKSRNINFLDLPEEEFDNPLGAYSGAGTIFGVTGGVMEAALRTGYEFITKQSIPNVDLTEIRGEEGFRTTEVQVGDLKLKVGIVSGLKNVVPLIERIKAGECDLHFVEVMTCPEGCVSGGGQPKLIFEQDKKVAYENRKAGLYKHDSALEVRKSHENEGVKVLYEEFLGEPLSHKSHELLHTRYKSRVNR